MDKKNIYYIAFVISLIVTIALFALKLYMYSIFCLVFTTIVLIMLLSEKYNNRNEDSMYENKIKKILKTYDAVLASCEEYPNLEDKNIVKLNTMDALINAQVEIRKPIYYKKEFDSCTFLLIDNNEVCVYSEKRNTDIILPIDNILKEIKIKKSKEEGKKFLEGIEKTTVIKIDDNKKYKISPIRENNLEKTIVDDKEFLKMLKAEYLPKLKEK